METASLDHRAFRQHPGIRPGLGKAVGAGWPASESFRGGKALGCSKGTLPFEDREGTGSGMQVVDLSGSPRAMGRAFGQSFRGGIHELRRVRLSNALTQALEYGGRSVGEDWLYGVARLCLPYVEAQHPEGFEELEGIAQGSGLSVEEVWAMNALTDLRDVAAFGQLALLPELPADEEGCSSVVVPGPASADGTPLVGQTWDLGTDNLPFVCVVRRRPEHGPATIALTTLGCLSLIGLNELGVAVGTTNLRTRDARPGVGYLDIIHKALAGDFESACDAVRDARRAGAHYYYIASSEGEAVSFECSADTYAEVSIGVRPYVHTNHILEPSLKSLEVMNTPTSSSHYRQSRLTSLVGSEALEAKQLRAFFADTDGGELAINRKDFGGISSNASVVMAPAHRSFWAVHGPADDGPWTAYPWSATSGR